MRFNNVMRDRDPIVDEVIRTAGTLAKVGDACGITAQAVADWSRVPAHQVIAVEALTGIPRERLRPDLYGAPRPRPKKVRAVEHAA